MSAQARVAKSTPKQDMGHEDGDQRCGQSAFPDMDPTLALAMQYGNAAMQAVLSDTSNEDGETTGGGESSGVKDVSRDPVEGETSGRVAPGDGSDQNIITTPGSKNPPIQDDALEPMPNPEQREPEPVHPVLPPNPIGGGGDGGGGGGGGGGTGSGGGSGGGLGDRKLKNTGTEISGESPAESEPKALLAPKFFWTWDQNQTKDNPDDEAARLRRFSALAPKGYTKMASGLEKAKTTYEKNSTQAWENFEQGTDASQSGDQAMDRYREELAPTMELLRSGLGSKTEDLTKNFEDKLRPLDKDFVEAYMKEDIKTMKSMVHEEAAKHPPPPKEDPVTGSKLKKPEKKGVNKFNLSNLWNFFRRRGKA